MISADSERQALVDRVKATMGKCLFSELARGLTPEDLTRVRHLLIEAHKRGEVVINMQDGDEDAIIIGVGP